MALSPSAAAFIEAHRQEAYDLLLELARIPSPSNHEEARASFCKAWLEKQGAEGVYIDGALNVILPLGDTDGPLTVFMAHSDVVFPDTEPLPLTVEDGKIRCPGVGDDSANVVALLMTAKYLITTGVRPADGGLLLAVNSGEEGLGNLRGSREICSTFGDRIRSLWSFDGQYTSGVDAAVGSRRYRITVTTEGGHSYAAFGNRNAIAYLASLIDTLYTVKVPEGGKTTYNVGVISGGTSVNSIAQQAEMLYEFRSDRREHLAVMERHLDAAVEFYRAKGVGVGVELIGERPCAAEVDPGAEQELRRRASDAVRTHCGMEIPFAPASTDCNIPLSLGIPSMCIGCYTGGGAHTREEWVDADSLLPGLKVALDLVLGYCEPS